MTTITTTTSNINKTAVTRRYSRWHTEVLVYLDNADMPEAHRVFNKTELADLMRDGFVTDYFPGPGWGAILSINTDRMLEAGFYTKERTAELRQWKAEQAKFAAQRQQAYEEWKETREGLVAAMRHEEWLTMMAAR
jgi:hypothetical protein